MAAEPRIPVFVKLPASMVDEASAAYSAMSGFPDPSRAAVLKAALGAYIVNARRETPAPAPPVARQRSRAMPVPAIPIARRAAAS